MPARSSLANLLRVALLAQAAAIAAWLFWRWPSHPGQAAIGVLVVALLPAIFFFFEFMILARVARSDTVPVPTLPELLKAWAGEIRELVRVFYWRLPFAWRDPDDHLATSTRGKPGIVFIHGFICNRGIWAPWMRALRARDQACVAVNLEPVFTSIDHYAPVIDAAVRRVAEATGQPPYLVCHSMGGLAARAWLRAAQGAGHEVRGVITIGSPHHGTWLARFSHVPNGRQMRRNSAWLAQLASDERALALPPFTCWYSNCDNIVFPTSTATLPGADNRLVRAAAHVDLAFHPEVMAASLALVSGERQLA
jgi:triacylglycerol lipase